MQKRNKLFKKSKWKLFLFLSLWGSMVSCSMSDTWYFKEAGTLLWLDGRQTDQVIKSAIYHTLEHSSIIVAQISWSPGDSSFFKNTAWYFSLAKDHGKSFMINIDWQKADRSGTTGDWSFNDLKTASQFKKDMLELIKAYNPDFINLGVEANYYALTCPDGFRAFVPLFRELKKEMKRLKPKIKVGLSYQLELLYGHHEGWEKSQTLNTLNVICGDIDFLGISTYPNMIVGRKLDDIFFSTNYIDSIMHEYSNIPMGISETGASSILYDGEQREAYVKAIFQKANLFDLKFVIWGSIIDSPKDEHWYNRIGLLDKEGFPKKEFEIWKSENEKFFR